MGFLKGKPLYLDAQATTPLVSIIDFKIIFRNGQYHGVDNIYIMISRYLVIKKQKFYFIKKKMLALLFCLYFLGYRNYKNSY